MTDFLHQLEAGSAANEEDLPRKRQPIGEQFRADQLVEAHCAVPRPSNSRRSRPSVSNKAAACKPPVRSNVVCADRCTAASP